MSITTPLQNTSYAMLSENYDYDVKRSDTYNTLSFFLIIMKEIFWCLRMAGIFLRIAAITFAIGVVCIAIVKRAFMIVF